MIDYSIEIDSLIKRYFNEKGLANCLECDSVDMITQSAMRLEDAGINYEYAVKILTQLWKKYHKYSESGYVRDDIHF